MSDDIDRWHAYEDEYGYVRACLTLTGRQDGGRQGPIASGYRSSWDVSREGDQSLLTDAPCQGTVSAVHPFRRSVRSVIGGATLASAAREIAGR
jgi:hypothetical protein